MKYDLIAILFDIDKNFKYLEKIYGENPTLKGNLEESIGYFEDFKNDLRKYKELKIGDKK